MSSCVFPGSFDPMTCGHLNLIQRAAAIFEEVSVTVMINRDKCGVIPLEERVSLIRKACGHIPNVRVELWDGLLADYIRLHPGAVVVRGVRSVGEFEREKAAAMINRQLNPGLETFLIPAADEWEGLSSTTVREIASFGGDISGYVPDTIYSQVLKWLLPKEKGKK